MKVSLFVHDLSSNPIVRAYPIAKAIQSLGHEVEILGLTYYTKEIYEPYRNEFEFKTIHSYDDIRWVIINGYKLSKMATGDIVYVFKPVWGTLWPGLLYAWFGLKKRIILDAEDNELWAAFIGNGWKALLKNKYYPVNPVYNKLLHPLTFLIKRKTVVCSQLQKRYGGKIVLHGPKAEKFDPALYPEKQQGRLQFNLPQNIPLLLFAGKPVYYNGVPALIKALSHPLAKGWHLVLAGNPQSDIFKEAKVTLGERCHLLGFLPNEKMPHLVNVVDLIPIIQTPIPSTEFQIPAKMLEAMAMGKGIITTNVCDMNTLLGEKRGWVLDYKNIDQLPNLLAHLEQHMSEIETKGKEARAYFLNEASIEVIAKKIEVFFK